MVCCKQLAVLIRVCEEVDDKGERTRATLFPAYLDQPDPGGNDIGWFDWLMEFVLIADTYTACKYRR